MPGIYNPPAATALNFPSHHFLSFPPSSFIPFSFVSGSGSSVTHHSLILTTISHLPWVSKDSAGFPLTCPASRLRPPNEPLPPPAPRRAMASVSDRPSLPLPPSPSPARGGLFWEIEGGAHGRESEW